MAQPLDRFPSGRMAEVTGYTPGSDDIPPDTPVLYRLGFTAVPVPGLARAVDIGRVTIKFGVGPVRTQGVQIQQRIPAPPVTDDGRSPVFFDKAASWTEVGVGRHLAICEIEDLAGKEPAKKLSEVWRNEALAAAGLLAAVLDERLFVEEVLEDVLPQRGEVRVMDIARRVRSRLPRGLTGEEITSLSQIADVDLSGSGSSVGLAARRYLKGARDGPTPDSIIDFWIAIEALSDDFSDAVKSTKEALRAAGFDPAATGKQIGINAVHELRNEIVHGGVERPADLTRGHYLLEAIVRVLIRHEVGVRIENGWHLYPGTPPGAQSQHRLTEVHEALDRKTVWPEVWLFHPDGLPDPLNPGRTTARMVFRRVWNLAKERLITLLKRARFTRPGRTAG